MPGTPTSCAAGAGPPHRRRRQRAVPVHAAGRPTTSPSCAHGRQKLVAKLRRRAEIVDVNSDQQDRGLETTLVVDRDTASRLGITTPQIDEHALRRLRPAPGRDDHLRGAEPVPRGDGGGAPQAAAAASTRRRCASTCCSSHRRGRASPGTRAFTRPRQPPRRRSLAVAHQGNRARRSTTVQPREGALARSQAVDLGPRRRSSGNHPACRRGPWRGFPARHRRSRRRSTEAGRLILASLAHRLHRAPACSTRTAVHPITILSTLPSAGSARCWRCWRSKTEFSVIALIGVILLIGIVKKNAIMMIDFALYAERTHGARPRRDPRGVSAALPADHDDGCGVRSASRSSAD